MIFLVIGSSPEIGTFEEVAHLRVSTSFYCAENGIPDVDLDN
jgi:hypothetical protein